MTSSTERLPRLADILGGWFSPKEQQSKENRETAAATTGGGFEQKPVVVWTAPHTLEARIVQGRLEAAGIPSILQGEAMSDILGLSSGGLAKTDVLVPAPLAEKALELLEIEFFDVEDSEDLDSHHSEDV